MIHFPNYKSKESITENEDGTYTIFIESSLSREEQQIEFMHAMKHLLGDDFEKDNVQQIEFEAHHRNFDYEISEEFCPAF